MKHHIFQMMRFGIVGSVNTALDFFVYFALTRGIEFFVDHRIVASIIAFLVAGLNSFYWNRHWTFKVQEHYTHAQLVRFYCSAGTALVINTGILWLLLERTYTHDLVAKIVASIAAGCVNFLLQKFWAFGSRRQS